MRRLALVLCCFAITSAAACSGGDDGKKKDGATVPDDLGPDAVPELGTSPAFTVIGSSVEGLDVPRDLAFHPTRDELWTVNRETDSTVIYFHPGMVTQSSQNLTDGYAMHFMEEPSAIAFGEPGFFGTCGESRNTYNGQAPPNDYMGPVLWSDDLAVYAQPSGTELGSHLDMLHESPNCMGMAWDTGNVYWVFDGHNANLVRYDFDQDHGPGNDNHGDGIVRRFTDIELTRQPDVISDMVIDHTTGLLYIADTATGRILWVDTTTGAMTGDLDSIESGGAAPDEYTEWRGAKSGLVARNLDAPSGLALDGNRLFVTEHGRGSITVFDLDEEKAIGRLDTPATSIMGIELGPDGKLWYVDAGSNELVRVDP